MPEKCQICGKLNDDRFEYVNVSFRPTLRLRVCGDCMNLLANEEWDKLNALLERHVPDSPSPEEVQQK